MNFGWAVIILTLLLRIVLLPFTLIDEYNQSRSRALSIDIEHVNRAYQKDAIMRKQEIRRLFNKRRVNPWAKIVVLGVQLLVLILLYQVFLRGITGEKVLQTLYPWVDFPGAINTNFYGFDVGRRYDLLWPGFAAVWLFIEVYFDLRQQKQVGFEKSDLLYLFLFPALVYLALWWLPMVKSLFILTSMAFSLIISQLSRVFFRPKKKTAPAAH